MSSGVWKLCQRRLYSWLSSRCGLPICIVGLLVLGISALQFGEVLMEWSRDKYAVQFSIYADNIVGKSYENKLCPPMPIDVVYTWVNGSDPILLRNISKLKQTLARKATPPPANVTTHPPPPSASDPLSCPFQDCVPWRTIIIDTSNLTHPLTMENIGRVLPSLGRGPVKCTFVNTSRDHVTPVYAVRMSHEDYVSSILSTGLYSSDGSVVLVTRGHLTSDPNLVGGVKMKTYHIALSNGIHPLNTSKLFRKWMVSHYGPEILEAEIKTNRTAVVRFKSERLESKIKIIPYQFFGENVTLNQAYLVWVPFSKPHSEEDIKLERPDVVSASRFQDNEELRYSLRSVVRFAPWIRHVFIVTNGQIPVWLNLDNPRVTLVTHKDIFVNQSHLPTYSSPAIESHLHRIPGLADHFIYLNDDVMFGDDVWPEDFYTHQRGQKVYLSWPIPNCADGCPPSWIRDHYCDSNCNNSACDWDGGDCVNASRPGPQGGHMGYHPSGTDYCSPGCLNSWLGDRYCDSACRVPSCGYDAGDCGTDKWEELLGYNLSRYGGNFSLPMETPALYFNLTDLFPNGSISNAIFTSSKLIRTAVVAQKYKTLAITIAKNVSWTSSNFTLSGTSRGNNVTVTFSIFGDSVTKNTSKVLLDEDAFSVSLNNTSSREFLEAVIEKLASNKSKSINYWIPLRSGLERTLPPPTLLSSYIVPNASLLPKNTAEALEKLETELKDGDITMKGYLIQKAELLKHHLHLVTGNGSVQFRKTDGQKEEDNIGQAHGRKEEDDNIELAHGEDDVVPAHTRKLLELIHKPPVLDWEESRRRLPWERLRLFPDRAPGDTPGLDTYEVRAFKSRKLMEEMTDTFADSLRYVNKLYTKVYGHSPRKVPSHMPHFIQKDVMFKLQARFPEEYDITSANVVRMANNMQYAFSYFYFLMSEKSEVNIEDAYKELDTDHTNILSVRELRTLLTMISELPITMKDVEKLEDILWSCDRAYNGTRPLVTAREYEILYDPNLPLVTLDFTKHCSALVEKLNASIGTRLRYKFEEITEDVIAFKMISENSSEVAVMLDEIRKKKKKFICLNDNIDHIKEGADISKLILIDFYESLFPIPSSFEIPNQYRNRFLHVDELKEWLVFKERTQAALYTVFAALLLVSLVSLFYGKLVQWKRKLGRFISSIIPSFRTRTLTPRL